jgi:ankyrin repeat protein
MSTDLCGAPRRGYILPAAELKKARLKVINIINYKGRTPLMSAAKSGHADCVKFLLEQGVRLFFWQGRFFTARAAPLSALNLLPKLL